MGQVMRPIGSTERVDLAVACVLAQTPASPTEICRALSKWGPEWKHSRSSVYRALNRFNRLGLLRKPAKSGRSVAYSFRDPEKAFRLVEDRYVTRYTKVLKKRGPKHHRIDGGRAGIERKPYPGFGYKLASYFITKEERRRLAAEIADPRYAPKVFSGLAGDGPIRVTTSTLEERASLLLRQKAKRRKKKR